MKKLISVFLLITLFCLTIVTGFAFTNFNPNSATADTIVKRFGFLYDKSRDLITIGTIPIVNSEVGDGSIYVNGKYEKMTDIPLYLRKMSNSLKSDKSIVVLQRYCFDYVTSLDIYLKVYDFSNVSDLSSISFVNNHLVDSSNQLEVYIYKVNSIFSSNPYLGNDKQNSANFINGQFNFSYKKNYPDRNSCADFKYIKGGTGYSVDSTVMPITNNVISHSNNKSYYETFILPNNFAQKLSQMPKLSNLKNFFVQNLNFAIETDEQETEPRPPKPPIIVPPEMEDYANIIILDDDLLGFLTNFMRKNILSNALSVFLLIIFFIYGIKFVIDLFKNRIR